VAASDPLARRRKTAPEIHPTAIVAPGAQLGSGVRIDAYAVIREHVTIGDGTWIGPHAVIEEWTSLGRDCRVYPCAVLGGVPQDYHFQGERSYLKIGDRVTLREYVSISRATGEDAATVVGDDAQVLAYSHAGHNCRIGRGVLVTNACQLGGHVVVEDRAVLGGMVGVLQFVHIGTLAMVGGFTRVVQDVPPYMLVSGSPPRAVAVNRIGLSRAGASDEVQESLRRAHRLLVRSGLDVSHAIERIEAEIPPCSELDHLVAFIRESAVRGTGIIR
jgi:UDP-N-acetylglucosamine acyltransferase